MTINHRNRGCTEIVLLYGNRTTADILLKEQLQGWAREHSRFRFIPVIGSRWSTNVRVNKKAPALPEGFTELAHPRCIELAQELQQRLWGCTTEEQRTELQDRHLQAHRQEFATLEPVAE